MTKAMNKVNKVLAAEGSTDQGAAAKVQTKGAPAKGKTGGAEAGKANAPWVPPTTSIITKCVEGVGHVEFEFKDSLVTVTFNILSLLLGGDGYNKDNYGNDAVWDNERRVELTCDYIQKTVREFAGRAVVFCLQETTYGFVNHALVRQLCNDLGYDCYSSYFGYMPEKKSSKEDSAHKSTILKAYPEDAPPKADEPKEKTDEAAADEKAEEAEDQAKTNEAVAKKEEPKKKFKGVNKLGLCTMVPIGVKVLDNPLIRPWKNPFIPIEDAQKLKKLFDQQEAAKPFLPELKSMGNNIDFKKLGDFSDQFGLSKKFLVPEFYKPPTLDLWMAGVWAGSNKDWESLTLRDKLANQYKKLHLWATGSEEEWEETCWRESVGQLFQAIVDVGKNLSSEWSKLYEPYKNTAPFPDRTGVLVLLEINGKKVLIVNIHLPCQWRFPKVMVTMAYKVLKDIQEELLTKPEYTGVPVVLCGDLNSSLGDKDNALTFLLGKLDYQSNNVARKFIDEESFESIKKGFSFEDVCADIPNRVTNYSLTRPALEDPRTKTTPLPDGETFYYPHPLCLDYILLDSQDRMEVVGVQCPTLNEVKQRFGKNPLPYMDEEFESIKSAAMLLHCEESNSIDDQSEGYELWPSDHLPVLAEFLLK